jgi:hypothetical protein
MRHQCTPADVLRFWSKVDLGGLDECWPYRSGRNRGYGIFWLNGRSLRANRLAWELTFGEIPDEQAVLHDCPGGDNSACCNPLHLWLGTDAENMQDRDRKGRQASGDRNGRRLHPPKLSADIAQRIRALKGKELQRETAERYQVTQQTVSRIQRGDLWGPH